MKLNPALKKKKLIVFDLDGTLTPSKSPLEADVRTVLVKLLEKMPVAVIGGGKFEQAQNQFVSHFNAPRHLMERLFLFPTSSTAFYQYRQGKFRKVYEHLLPKKDRAHIQSVILKTAEDVSYPYPKKRYGKVIEDRGTQITFSALGQDIVDTLGLRGVRVKKEWNKKYNHLRLKLASTLQKKLPKYLVRTGGLTSIDVTKKGIDKAYGVRQISKRLKVPIKDMVFVGDALYPGGNDFAAKKTGVTCIQVSGPKDTAQIIKFLLKG